VRYLQQRRHACAAGPEDVRGDPPPDTLSNHH
jgi:hypothetical protein